ncbi:MAG: hypothetical protein JNL50_14110 [Phycisphaerae bacterium]|nr:hypothetical protein [Phycisphaerae bacterium]
MVKSNGHHGALIALVGLAFGAAFGVALPSARAQATDDKQAPVMVTPPVLPPAPPPVRWTPGPGRSTMMPRTGAGMPGRDGKDIWRRVPKISVGPEPARPARPVDPNPRPPVVVTPGPVFINNGNVYATNPLARRDLSGTRDMGGVSVSGSYSDDRFRLSASVSSAIANAAYRNWVGADNRSYYRPYSSVYYNGGRWGLSIGHNWGSSWGWGSCGGGGFYPWGFDRYWGYDPSWGNVRVGSTYNYYGPDPALDVNYQPSQAPAPSVAPMPPPTPDELARMAMGEGRYADGAEALRVHLKDNPTDPAAMRRLGIAQLLSRKWDDGFAQVARAYHTDPVLSDVALTGEELGVRDDVLRELTGRVVSRARQGRSRDAWMTAAILMQSRGKHEQAITMLEAAKNAGMDATLYARMRQAMAR